VLVSDFEFRASNFAGAASCRETIVAGAYSAEVAFPAVAAKAALAESAATKAGSHSHKGNTIG